MKFEEYVKKINERRIPGFDGYAQNKKRASGFRRHITSKSTVGNPRLMIPRVGDEHTSPQTKKRNDQMRHVLKAGKFTNIKN